VPYYLGADLGASKTHLAIADECGRVVGFGHSGPGNHQVVGFEGMLAALRLGLAGGLADAGLTAEAIAGAGFGIAGYDWPSERPVMEEIIGQLGLACPIALVNDAVLGLVAGARDGWGVALVSGTGCNCRGLDRQRRHEGRMTGDGYNMGEYAGASELVWRAMQLVANEWTRRGPATALSPALVQHAGARDLDDLIEGYTKRRYFADPQAAPVIFDVARSGDPVARDLIRWAGSELGEMARAVIRQLDMEDEEFDVVLAGSMFDGGPLLIEPLAQTITALAPRARLVRLSSAPVIGALILGMEAGGLVATTAIRRELADTLATARQKGRPSRS
jgi:N-acetylglucosamine kinase-like BadF-type ATPase